LDTEYFLEQLSIDQLEKVADEIEHQSGIQISWESEEEAVDTLTEIIDRTTSLEEPIVNKKTQQKPQESDNTVVDLWRDKSESDVTSARSKQASAKRRLASQLNTFNRCPYCTQKLAYEQSHVDHIHPVSRGGLSEDDNLVLVCAPCNISKGKKTLRAFCRDTDLNYDVVVARLEAIGKNV
jgi:5-methylcytosine-specific restriction endonuclease McrA